MIVSLSTFDPRSLMDRGRDIVTCRSARFRAAKFVANTHRTRKKLYVNRCVTVIYLHLMIDSQFYLRLEIIVITLIYFSHIGYKRYHIYNHIKYVIGQCKCRCVLDTGSLRNRFSIWRTTFLLKQEGLRIRYVILP